jgi:hypothetical protein
MQSARWVVESEQLSDLCIPRAKSKLTKGSSVCVARVAERGEPFEEPCNPTDIAYLDGVGQIGELNSQEPSHFTQVLDRPASRSRAELVIGAIDVCAPFEQQLNHLALSIERRVMKGRGARFVWLIRESRIGVKNRSDTIHLPLLYCLDQVRHVVYRNPPSGARLARSGRRFQSTISTAGCKSEWVGGVLRVSACASSAGVSTSTSGCVRSSVWGAKP